MQLHLPEFKLHMGVFIWLKVCNIFHQWTVVRYMILANYRSFFTYFQRDPSTFIITSAKEVMFSPGFVCEFVCAFVCEQDNSKTYGQILNKTFRICLKR